MGGVCKMFRIVFLWISDYCSYHNIMHSLIWVFLKALIKKKIFTVGLAKNLFIWKSPNFLPGVRHLLLLPLPNPDSVCFYFPLLCFPHLYRYQILPSWISFLILVDPSSQHPGSLLHFLSHPCACCSQIPSLLSSVLQQDWFLQDVFPEVCWELASR